MYLYDNCNSREEHCLFYMYELEEFIEFYLHSVLCTYN